MSHHNLADGNKWVPNELTIGSIKLNKSVFIIYLFALYL